MYIVAEGDQPMEYFESIPRRKLSGLLVRKRPPKDVLTNSFQSASIYMSIIYGHLPSSSLKEILHFDIVS